MRIKKLIAVGSVATVTALAATGIALANGRTSAPTRPTKATVVSATDTDNIQEGDQNSPDTAGQATETSATATSATTKVSTGSAQSGENEGSGEGESTGESDGPGGHQDPPGDVNHEFDGEE